MLSNIHLADNLFRAAGRRPPGTRSLPASIRTRTRRDLGQICLCREDWSAFGRRSAHFNEVIVMCLKPQVSNRSVIIMECTSGFKTLRWIQMLFHFLPRIEHYVIHFLMEQVWVGALCDWLFLCNGPGLTLHPATWHFI